MGKLRVSLLIILFPILAFVSNAILIKDDSQAQDLYWIEDSSNFSQANETPLVTATLPPPTQTTPTVATQQTPSSTQQVLVIIATPIVTPTQTPTFFQKYDSPCNHPLAD